jgi:tryptophan halogenase
MSKKINKIVIVGGGSAGWMTASILVKDFPNKEIILVESKNVPTVGVGESTYDGINNYFQYLEINRDDFFKYTDASIKLGIEFENFYEKNNESFLYPFGGAVVADTAYGMHDWFIKKANNPEISVKDFAESFFPVTHLINNNTFTDNKNNEFPNFNPVTNTALHFDAQKFALWLKEKYALPRGIKVITGDVTDIKTNVEGISSIIVNDTININADLFVDCTGFKSLLLGETIKEKFISYTDKLPNNRAWATQIPYMDKENELTTITKCTALKNGWVWNIPLYSRIGSGYVYSDNFITKEKALEEFKDYLSSKYAPNKRSKEFINSLEFKDISMKVGIHEKTWSKNVVAIGLSAGFIEPLESNGLFTVIEFLFNLVRTLRRDKITSWDIHCYNEANYFAYNSFAEFICTHYCLSIRDDSEYWKTNSERKYSFDLYKLKESLSGYIYSLYNMRMFTHETPFRGGYSTGLLCISTGMNFPVFDEVSVKIADINHDIGYLPIMQKWFDKLDNKKYFWNNIAKKSLSINQYLIQKYHSEKTI